jgi:hypothetical protein
MIWFGYTCIVVERATPPRKHPSADGNQESLFIQEKTIFGCQSIGTPRNIVMILKESVRLLRIKRLWCPEHSIHHMRLYHQTPRGWKIWCSYPVSKDFLEVYAHPSNNEVDWPNPLCKRRSNWVSAN